MSHPPTPNLARPSQSATLSRGYQAIPSTPRPTQTPFSQPTPTPNQTITPPTVPAQASQYDRDEYETSPYEPSFSVITILINTPITIRGSFNTVRTGSLTTTRNLITAVLAAIKEASSSGYGIPMIDEEGRPRPVDVKVDMPIEVFGTDNDVDVSGACEDLGIKPDDAAKAQRRAKLLAIISPDGIGLGLAAKGARVVLPDVSATVTTGGVGDGHGTKRAREEDEVEERETNDKRARMTVEELQAELFGDEDWEEGSTLEGENGGGREGIGGVSSQAEDQALGVVPGDAQIGTLDDAQALGEGPGDAQIGTQDDAQGQEEAQAQDEVQGQGEAQAHSEAQGQDEEQVEGQDAREGSEQAL